MEKIDPAFHREINNRRLQEECIKGYLRHTGLISTLDTSDKTMIEIADLEDECLIKMRELTLENQKRVNKQLDELRAQQQDLKIERVKAQMARSNVGPALLYQIQKKNEETAKVLRDMAALDEKMESPQKFD
mgnify:CR=1 FL=1